MGMHTCKLPLIVIVVPESCIVKKQIGVGKFKYGVTGDPHLQVVKGSRDLRFEFCDPLHIGIGWS